MINLEFAEFIASRITTFPFIQETILTLVAEIKRLSRPPALSGIEQRLKGKHHTEMSDLSVWDVQLLIAEIQRLRAVVDAAKQARITSTIDSKDRDTFDAALIQLCSKT